MKKNLNHRELSFFFGQLSMILHAGLSLPEGILILREDTPGQEGARVLSDIQNSLDQGSMFFQALEQSGVFPDYAVHMTRLGEESGTLEEVSASLGRYYEREDDLRNGIRASLTYPSVMLAMLCAVLIVLAVKVMPVFDRVYQELGTEMSGLSRSVLTAGTFLGRYAFLFVFLALAALLFFLFLSRTKSGRRLGKKMLYAFPPLRSVLNQLSCSSFAGGLSIALRSGLDLEESFSLILSLTENPVFLKKAKQVRLLMENGQELTEALGAGGVFSGLHARMVSIGFKTGQGDAVLEKIAEECQSQADEKIQSAVAALEPALVAALSILVGLILLSVMLPLAGILSSIG